MRAERVVEEAKAHGWLRGLVNELRAGAHRATGDACPPAAVPGLNGTLRDYQLRGVEWLRFLTGHGFGALLADDMGLGKTVQVSESTVVRFATQLGYDGYPSMQRALQEMIRGKLTSIQRIKASEGELSGSDLVTNVLQRDMEKIRMAMDQTDGSEFSHVVDIIAQAKHIYIVGFRSSSFLAGYLNFYFRLIYDNVTQVQGGAAGTFDQLFRVGPGDVVIAICFPRYSELALKTVQYAKDRGATIIGVTDSEMSPVYQMSSGSLLVRNEMISFVDSLAAPMSMLNALILAAAHKQGTDISATFNELEHVWDRFGIFGKVEDE